jgi:hypothetical protein
MKRKDDPRWQGLIQKRVAQHFRQFHSEGVGRRSFLQRTAGAAGLALTSGLWMSQRGNGQDTAAEPKPIPGGAMPLGILVHHFPLPSLGTTPLANINDPSEITDFNGFIGDTHIRGAGSGTGFAMPLAYQTDMGFMQGEYVGEDGEHHHGTFVFILNGHLHRSGRIGEFDPADP